MRCIAIDDEPLALNVIKEFCIKIDFLELIACYTNAIEAVDCIKAHAIDIIFIDIKMPNINGIEFIRSLQNPPHIIFTTAFSEFAVDGFDLNATDYLVKPIPFERFFKAVTKVREALVSQNNNKPSEDFMLVKVEYSTVKVDFNEILYIEGLKDYIRIITREKSILTKSTLKNVEERLPSDTFLRTHKSFIVSILHIRKIEGNRISISEKLIPIGNNYKENLSDKLSRYKL